MSLTFNIRLFTWLAITFIVATIIGTFSHECGHYIVAKLLGYKAELHYASVSYLPLTKEQVYNQLNKILIRAAGPLQTIITGTIGFLLLCKYDKHLASSNQISIRSWILIFLSLFWLRQVTNLVVLIAQYIFKGSLTDRDDESRISLFFQMPSWVVLGITGLIGTCILCVIIFRFLPVRYRFTFMTAGLIGGIAGYFIWLIWLGKFILP